MRRGAWHAPGMATGTPPGAPNPSIQLSSAEPGGCWNSKSEKAEPCRTGRTWVNRPRRFSSAWSPRAARPRKSPRRRRTFGRRAWRGCGARNPRPNDCSVPGSPRPATAPARRTPWPTPRPCAKRSSGGSKSASPAGPWTSWRVRARPCTGRRTSRCGWACASPSWGGHPPPAIGAASRMRTCGGRDRRATRTPSAGRGSDPAAMLTRVLVARKSSVRARMPRTLVKCTAQTQVVESCTSMDRAGVNRAGVNKPPTDGGFPARARPASAPGHGAMSFRPRRSAEAPRGAGLGPGRASARGLGARTVLGRGPSGPWCRPHPHPHPRPATLARCAKRARLRTREPTRSGTCNSRPCNSRPCAGAGGRLAYPCSPGTSLGSSSSGGALAPPTWRHGGMRGGARSNWTVPTEARTSAGPCASRGS